MRSPIAQGRGWLELDDVESTQAIAAQCLAGDEPIGVVFAQDQTAGYGRFKRPWFSEPGASLTMSLIFHDYADHPKPYLVGMAVACAAAGALHCRLRWPNDLTLGERKLGGILTELLPDPAGRKVPIVGIGANLNQIEFPESIAEKATSLALEHGGSYSARSLAEQIVERIALLPEPDSWAKLFPIWDLFDMTPGKIYRLPSGEEAISVGIGSEGQLLCSVDGESRTVLAAEALFG